MSEFREIIAEWKESGLVIGVRWHTANDDLVCSVCEARAENEFSLDEIENLIPAHEGCRCWLTPITKIRDYEKLIDEAFGDVSS